jgi:hypothetical protein
MLASLLVFPCSECRLVAAHPPRLLACSSSSLFALHRTATSSMTSVPKPLKFLRPHYDKLKAQLEGTAEGQANRQQLADVVSQPFLLPLWVAARTIRSLWRRQH